MYCPSVNVVSTILNNSVDKTNHNNETSETGANAQINFLK